MKLIMLNLICAIGFTIQMVSLLTNLLYPTHSVTSFQDLKLGTGTGCPNKNCAVASCYSRATAQFLLGHHVCK